MTVCLLLSFLYFVAVVVISSHFLSHLCLCVYIRQSSVRFHSNTSENLAEQLVVWLTSEGNGYWILFTITLVMTLGQASGPGLVLTHSEP